MKIKMLLLLSLFVFAGQARAQLDLWIDRIEVTQAIQDRIITGTPRDNIIRLVANKLTVARVYVGFSGSDVPVPDVTAVAYVYQGGKWGEPIYPDNSAITAPVPPSTITRIDPRSSTENFTLNFTLPAISGNDVLVWVAVNADQIIEEIDYDNNAAVTDFLTFECRRVPSIVSVPVNYLYPPGTPDPNLPDPELIAAGVGDVFVRGIYPVADLNYYQDPGEQVVWTLNINGSSSNFLNQMATRRMMYVPRPDFLYAWFRGNPFSGNGQAFPSGLVAFGNTDLARFQRTFAHELGHLFGLGHNTRRLDQVGFDTPTPTGWLGLGRVKGTTLFDIMAAGRLTAEAWVDIANYNHFLNRPVLSCPPGPGKNFNAANDRFMLLTGLIQPDGRAKLNPAYTLNGNEEYTRSSDTPTHDIVLLDGQGQELYRVAIDVKQDNPWCGDGQVSSARDLSIAVVLPSFADLAKVQLTDRQGNNLAVMERQAEALRVDLDDLPSNLIGKNVVSWQTNKSDVNATVRYSSDNGQTWVPIAVNLSENNLTLDSARLKKPIGNSAAIQVLVTDGLNTAVVERRGLNVF